MWISVHVNGNRFVIFTTESLTDSRLNLFCCRFIVSSMHQSCSEDSKWLQIGFAKTLNRPSTLKLLSVDDDNLSLKRKNFAFAQDIFV